MLTTITDHILFENAEPSAVFDLYTNAEKHRQFSAAPVSISSQTGEEFSAYGGYCFGKNLYIETNKLIVQSWKAQGWQEEAEPSLVSLRLVKENNHTHVFLAHADIPADKAGMMLKGWEEWYWKPMRKYLDDRKTN